MVRDPAGYHMSTVTTDDEPREKEVRPMAESGSCSDPEPDRHVHIVVMGLMGTGKTTVGRLVANELGRPFVDNDSIVELRTGSRPGDFLARGGSLEDLHRTELTALLQIIARSGSVVYAAAASVVDHITADDVGAAWCVWLDTSPSVLTARTLAHRQLRPLLGAQREDLFEEQHARRTDRGRAIASYTIHTDGLTPNDVAERICAAWRTRAGRESVGDDARRRPR
jgi:shikimate kinase